MANSKVMQTDFVVVGGGVSGVSCCQLLAEIDPSTSIILIAPKDIVKLVTNHRRVTRTLDELVVEERPSILLSEKYSNITVINEFVTEVHHRDCVLKTSGELSIHYKKLCLCLGGKPKLIKFKDENIIGIRDLDSVAILQQKLKNARRVVVVGNGGIALELVYELKGCEVIWAIKADTIGNVFLDKAAANFLLENLDNEADQQPRKSETTIFKRKKYTIARESRRTEKGKESIQGGALGPDWSLNARLEGKESDSTESTKRKVHIENNCEVESVMKHQEFVKRRLHCAKLPEQFKVEDQWPLYVELTNGQIFGTDLIVSATGTIPNSDINIVDGKLKLAEDGGIEVDDNMRTNLPHVYAAGDNCTATWEPSPNWFQMRLWTQAYQMGIYSAKCMSMNLVDKEASLDICFDMFAHATTFFGHKLCLLGRYNAQGLSDYELHLRYSPGIEYVKVVLQDGILRGALLLGETDLEETFENLILNELDLSRFEDSLLDPDFQLDDYFD